MFLFSDNILIVLGAASHLQMLPIVDACERYLYSQLDLENCVDLVSLAELYTLPQLCHKAYCYIGRKLEKLARTKEFQQLTAMQLLTLLSNKYPVACSELEVAEALTSWLLTDLTCRKMYAGKLLDQLQLQTLRCGQLEELRESLTSLGFVKEIPTGLCKTPTSYKRTIEVLPDGLKNTRGFEAAIINVGGFQASIGTTNALMYHHINSDKWSHLAPTPAEDMSSFGVAVLDNNIYVVGGCFHASMDEDIHPLGYKYDVWTDKWTCIASMNNDRCNFYLGSCAGRLYAIGGESSLDNFMCPVLECEYYDPKTNKWTNNGAIPSPRKQGAGCTTDTCVYISGGLWTSPQDSLFMYDTINNKWFTKSSMRQPRADHCMAVLDQHIYVVGGWSGDPTVDVRSISGTVDRYDIKQDQWSQLAYTPTPRYLASMVAHGSKLYIIGGYGKRRQLSRATRKIEVYNVTKEDWEEHCDYPVSLWEHESCVIHVPIYRDG